MTAVGGHQVIVEVVGEQVADVHVDGRACSRADLPDLPDRAGPALLALAADHPEAAVAWVARGAAHRLTDPAGWPQRLASGFEARSVGSLHGRDPWLGTLGAADFDSALQMAPPADRPFGTWLLSPLGGVAGPGLLAAAGAPAADLPFATWVLVLGCRAYRAGALLWSDPALVRPPHRADHVAVHSARTAALATRHAFGRRFLLPWTATPQARRHPGPALAAAATAAARPDRTTPPRPVDWTVADRPGLPDPPPEIDVIVPTLGRRALLLDALDDLAQQTLRPRTVVVVEQTGGAEPGLGLDPGRWPFPLEHVQIERLGAGNARNVAIARTGAPWLLMLDDDVRLAPDVVERLWLRLCSSGADAVTARLDRVPADRPDPLADPAPPDAPLVRMWPGFGSGGALVARELVLAAGGFDRRIDGGFGEDTELGVRLRQAGAMVVLATDPPIAHLKAPEGGMRAPFPHPWRASRPRPRPSPTVLLARRSFETPAMATGYAVHWWLHALLTDRTRFRPWQRWRAWRAAHRWADVLDRSEDPAAARALPPAGADSRARRPPEPRP